MARPSRDGHRLVWISLCKKINLIQYEWGRNRQTAHALYYGFKSPSQDGQVQTDYQVSQEKENPNNFFDKLVWGLK